MNKVEKNDNNLDNLLEKQDKICEESTTETESKYDQYEPVACLNCGYH